MTTINNETTWSRGNLIHIAHCPCCNSNKQNIQVYKRADNDLLMPDIWHIAECNICKSLWLENRPDEISLPKAYDNYYTHEADNENIDENKSNRLIWKLIYGYLNQRFSMKYKKSYFLGYILFSLIEPWRLKLDYYGRHLTYKNVGKPGKLLDIGCGNGSFLQRATDMGWEAQGCEIDYKAIKTCRDQNLNVLQGDAFHFELKPNSFDVITLSHVIEHVEDQKALLNRIYDLLKPNGVLWMAAPNPNGIGKKIFRDSWSELHPPCHLIIPSITALNNLLTECQFVSIVKLRRGAHAKRVWRPSIYIAKTQNLIIKNNFVLKLYKVLVDLWATISTEKAEEVIFMARKK